MSLGNAKQETLAFTRLCERADCDADARAEVEREIAERTHEMRSAALARKAAERPRHARYDRSSDDRTK